MEEITIKSFKGMNLTEGLWDQGFSGYTMSMDFFGLGDDQTKLSYNGIAQGALSLSAMGQAAGGSGVNLSAVNNLIGEFAYFPKVSQTYAIDVNSTARLYTYVPGSSQWQLTRNLSSISGGNTMFSQNLAVYNNVLYYSLGSGTLGTVNGQLGSYDGTTWDDWFQVGLVTQSPMPMKVFNGYLFVGNDQYVDRYDGTTYTKQKLTLPKNFVVRSMEVYQGSLYISADNGQYSRIFIWDGSSPTFIDQIPLQAEGFAPTLITAQGYLWMVGNRGTNANTTPITFLTPIYIYQGGIAEFLFNLPLFRNTSFAPQAGVAAYQGGILVASDDNGLSVDTSSGADGVWYIGKNLTTGVFHASLLFGFNLSKVKVGAIFSGGQTQAGTKAPAVYISSDRYTSGNTYEIFQVASPSVSPNTWYEPTWQSLPIDAASTKKKNWVALKANFDALTTNQVVDFYYRLDDTTTWTLAKEWTSSNPSTDRFMWVPISRTSRTITVRFEFASNFASATASTATPRLHSFTLFYQPTGT